MKVKEKLKAYIVGLIREESEELAKRQKLLEENVRDLNAQMEGQEAIAENVRNLNAQMESQEAIADNVRNLNVQMEVVTENVRNLNVQIEAIAENVQNLNAQIEVQEAIAENVRNLNAQVENQEKSQQVLEENVRNLNAQMEWQESLAENVRNLNTQMENQEKKQEALEENVRNLNAQMEWQESLAENVRNLNTQMENQEKGQEVLEENVQNLNAQMESQESLAENVRNLNVQMESQEKKQEVLEENVGNLNAQMEWQESLAENVRNLNAQMENQEKKQEALEENIRNLNTIFQDHNKVTENLQNNNSIIEKISSTLEMLKVKFAMFEKVNQPQHNNPIVFDDSDGKANEKLISKEDMYSGIDYFDFENYFRGSIEQIKRNQQQYLKYYEGKSNVIDLGCGRGEFLTLLSENGIKAKGVDLYEEFVQMCTMNGLDVVCDDALRFLHTQRKVGGIFAGQLIEHLTINQLVELCNIAYEKLEEDAYIIMETPNPTCLAIYSHAFYIDPSHNKPVHPLTIKYILEKSGFKNIEIIYTDTSKLPVSIPEISGIEEADKFNEVMHMISELLFGSQDYAVIAKKC